MKKKRKYIKFRRNNSKKSDAAMLLSPYHLRTISVLSQYYLRITSVSSPYQVRINSQQRYLYTDQVRSWYGLDHIQIGSRDINIPHQHIY